VSLGWCVGVWEGSGVSTRVGEGDGGINSCIFVTDGVTAVGFFSVAEPWQAETARHMISRQKMAERFNYLILPCLDTKTADWF
jgi:hypothetical protein